MHEGETCNLDDNQKIRSKDWFMQNKWRINFRTNDNSFQGFSDLTIKNINDKSCNSYIFDMRGND